MWFLQKGIVLSFLWAFSVYWPRLFEFRRDSEFFFISSMLLTVVLFVPGVLGYWLFWVFFDWVTSMSITEYSFCWYNGEIQLSKTCSCCPTLPYLKVRSNTLWANLIILLIFLKLQDCYNYCFCCSEGLAGDSAKHWCAYPVRNLH